MDIPNEPPACNALVIADHVYRDAETGKWIIAGVFSTITVTAVPYLHPRMEVFFQVTNIAGKADLRFRIEHADSGDQLLDFGGAIAAESPLDVHEHKIALEGIPFRKPGKYWIQVVSAEEILTQAPMYVRIQGQGGSESPG